MEALPITMAAVWVQSGSAGAERAIGLAVLEPRPRASRADRKSARMTLYQFTDARLNILEGLLVRHSPEFIYGGDSGGGGAESGGVLARLCLGLGDAGTPYETVPKSKFAEAESVSALATLGGGNSSESAPVPIAVTAAAVASSPPAPTPAGSTHIPDGDDSRLARKAASCLIFKGKLLEHGDSAGSVEVLFAHPGAYARLDAAALRALNLFAVPGQGGSSALAAAALSFGAATEAEGWLGGCAGGLPRRAPSATSVTSVHALLSAGCRTKGGRRVLKGWLLQPLIDVGAIEARQQLVAAFVGSTATRKSWATALNSPDLEQLASRLANKVAAAAAGLTDLQRLYRFAATALPELRAVLANYDGPPALGAALASGFADKLAWADAEFGGFKAMCEQVVEDLDAAELRVAPGYDEELQALAVERGELEGAILEVFNKAQKGWARELDGGLKCQADKLRGYVFRTRPSNEKTVRATPGTSICQVLKDGLYFTTLGQYGLKVLADRLKELEEQYAVKSREIIAEAVGIAASYVPVLEVAAAAVSELDAYASMAAAAVSAPGGAYVRPRLTSAGTGDIVIRGARHPLMEHQEGVSFVANDYVMRRATSRFQIITGPNMGGKSTYIRTLGTLAVMAQVGSFLPVEAASMPVFDCVAARVGAGDTAVKGVSTFMAEMTEAASILAVATHASLVIVDELGRGTSTFDGFGLAWAISEHLAAKTCCMTLFATHFHELTSLERSQPGVTNKHVYAEVGSDRITMLYAIEDGPCSSSFGIHVAEQAAFPSVVIADARKKAALLEASCGSASAAIMAAAGAAAGTAAAEGGSGGPGGGSAKRSRDDETGASELDNSAAAAAALDIKRRHLSAIADDVFGEAPSTAAGT